jgi:lysophospholipase L1-like esterase
MMKLRPDWTVFNRGVNGEESSEILERLSRDVVVRKPEYVVILAGVNDVYRGRAVRTITSNLSAMYAGAHAAGIRVVAASVLPFNSMSRRQIDALRELNAWIEREADQSGDAFCDTHALTSDPRTPNRLAGSPDGLHPDVAGYRRMGEGIVAAIERSLSGSGT